MFTCSYESHHAPPEIYPTATKQNISWVLQLHKTDQRGSAIEFLVIVSLVRIRHPVAPDGRRIRRHTTVRGVRETPEVERAEHHQVKQNHVKEHKVPDRRGVEGGSWDGGGG